MDLIEKTQQCGLYGLYLYEDQEEWKKVLSLTGTKSIKDEFVDRNFKREASRRKGFNFFSFRVMNKLFAVSLKFITPKRAYNIDTVLQ